MKRCLLTALSTLLLAPTVSAIIDSNSNGLSDLWERAYNNDELFAETFDPQNDDDADGWTNAQEAAAGTNPFDPNPPYGLIRPETAHIPAVYGEPDENGIPELVTPEAVTVTWPTLVGKQYTLLFSPDLSAESWFPVGAPYIGNGNDFVYGFETNDTDSRFWRVAVTDVDTDGDGLTDSEEGQLGTDSTERDTDHDGVSDWDELMANSTNPLLALDLDSDGMADDLEKHLAKQFLAVNPAPEFWGTRYQDLQNGNLDASFDYTGDGLGIGSLIPTLTVIPQAGPSESGFLLEAQERHNSLLGYFQIPDPLNYPEGEATGQYHFSIPHESDGNTDLYSLSDLNPAYLTTRIDSLAYAPYSNPTLVPWIVALAPYWTEAWSGFESGPVPGNATRYQGRIRQTRMRLVATRADHLDLTQTFLKVTSKRQINDLGFGEVLTAEPNTITLPKGRFATEWIDFQPSMTSGQETVERLEPIEVMSDLNNDGKIDSNDNVLCAKAANSTDEAVLDAGTEYIFLNDSLSNGKWDKADQSRPTGETSDDDAEPLRVICHISGAKVRFEHPAISQLAFYSDNKCDPDSRLALSWGEEQTITQQTPLPETIFVRAEEGAGFVFPANNPQASGELVMKIRVNNNTYNGPKIRLVVVKQIGATKYFDAARDYILEKNTRFHVYDSSYDSGSAVFRVVSMREEAATMYPIDASRRSSGVPLKGIDQVNSAFDGSIHVIVNGNMNYFSDDSYNGNVGNLLASALGLITDKCHGRVVRMKSLDALVSSDNTDTTTSPAGSELAGDALGRFCGQSDLNGFFAAESGRVPIPEVMIYRSAIGGLSTNYGNPQRIDREYQFLGLAEDSDPGKGIVFTATQVVGVGFGPNLASDAKNSGVRSLPGGDADDLKILLLDGGTSTALSYASPTDNLVTRVKSSKHTGTLYYINTYVLFHCDKPRP